MSEMITPPPSHKEIQYSQLYEKLSFYPEIEPYKNGFLEVSGGHKLYWEECGNPRGQPILFLHGGPGMGISPLSRRYFDPQHYRIILLDQRGAGKSTPYASTENNTTWDLVQDIDTLRQQLKVDAWIVFGGSWGSTLALAYAENFPKNVKGLILRGIFLCRPKELAWFYQYGAHQLFPDAWEQFIAPIPVPERDNLIQAYNKRLTSSNKNEREQAAKAWSKWEGSVVTLVSDPKVLNIFEQNAEGLARLECHYFINRGFFKTTNWLIENISVIRHIPCTIIHGRYDIPCPVESAWELHKAWPESKLIIIPDAGHSANEPGTLDALIRTTNNYRSL